MAYSDLLAAAQSTFDATFGETFTIRPRLRNPNARPAPDPTRPPASFAAVLSEMHARAGFTNAANSQFENSAGGLHASARSMLSVAIVSLPYAVIVGDRVVRDATGEEFSVSEVRPEGDGRLALDLTSVA